MRLHTPGLVALGLLSVAAAASKSTSGTATTIYETVTQTSTAGTGTTTTTATAGGETIVIIVYTAPASTSTTGNNQTSSSSVSSTSTTTSSGAFGNLTSSSTSSSLATSTQSAIYITVTPSPSSSDSAAAASASATVGASRIAGLTTGAFAGLIVGVVVALGLLLVATVFFVRWLGDYKDRREWQAYQDMTGPGGPYEGGGHYDLDAADRAYSGGSGAGDSHALPMMSVTGINGMRGSATGSSAGGVARRDRMSAYSQRWAKGKY